MFSEESLMCLLEEVESQGGEGLMINLNGKYECKRTKQLLKVKTFNSADVLVVGVYEGEKGKEFEGCFPADCQSRLGADTCYC